MNKHKKKIKKLILMLMFSVFVTIASYFNLGDGNLGQIQETDNYTYYDLSNVPEYSGRMYVEINNNIPTFTREDMNITKDYYSDLKDGKVRNDYDKNEFQKGKFG